MCFSGKSTIGKYLGEAVDIQFLDSRDIFYQKHNVHDLEFLEKYGKDSFCKAEKDSFLQDFGEKIIALSGSALYLEEVMNNVKQNGILIWLKPTIDVILNRKELEESSGKIRPIVFPNGINSFNELFQSRESIYKKWNPHIIVSISNNDTVDCIVKKIISKLD